MRHLHAIDLLEPITALLTQGVGETPAFDQARALLVKLAMQSGEMVNVRRQQTQAMAHAAAHAQQRSPNQ